MACAGSETGAPARAEKASLRMPFRVKKLWSFRVGLRELEAVYACSRGGLVESGLRRGSSVTGIARVFQTFLQFRPAETLHASVSQANVALFLMHIVHPSRSEARRVIGPHRDEEFLIGDHSILIKGRCR